MDRADVSITLLDRLDSRRLSECRRNKARRTPATAAMMVRSIMGYRQMKRLCILSCVLVAGTIWMIGCEVQSFMDPSKTGYLQHTPISMPVLARIDVIERDLQDKWQGAEGPTAADLVPSTLEYRLTAGDVITVEIFELLQENTYTQAVRQIDQSGNVRLPDPLRDFPAVGKTPRDLEDSIAQFLEDGDFIVDPQVTVIVNQGSAFSYSVTGNVFNAGLFPLSRPDLHLRQALSAAGGVPPSAKTIYVIRSLSLTEQGAPPVMPDRDEPGEVPPDVEDILDQLDDGEAGGGGGASAAGASGSAREPRANAAVMQDSIPLIDIDDLQPRRVADRPGPEFQSTQNLATRSALRNDSFHYDELAGRWVATLAQDDGQDELTGDVLPGEEPVSVTRIIRIPYDRLLTDASYDVIIRPGDDIYAEPPPQGFIYIEGEVARPGVYTLPPFGELTLSRAISSAGGLGALAIPDRVDLIRRVPGGREAAMRMNLGAIRKRNEPDIVLRADDHIIIGTNFWAAPLAVIRNGFRATYGFGFLLDRNFGNDVFGAPPTNRLQ